MKPINNFEQVNFFEYQNDPNKILVCQIKDRMKLDDLAVMIDILEDAIPNQYVIIPKDYKIIEGLGLHELKYYRTMFDNAIKNYQR